MFSFDLDHFLQDPGESGSQIDGNMGAALSHLRAFIETKEMLQVPYSACISLA